jgi:hypothetical protein
MTNQMKTRSLINILLLLVPTIGMGFDYHSLADAVALAESNRDYQAVGDSGKARGAWQMWRIAWDQTNKVRKAAGLKQYPWSYAHDQYVGRMYAVEYLRWCGGVLERHLGRKPFYWEVYAAYARGPETFIDDHSCSYPSLPARTHRAIRIIAAQLKEPTPR